MHVNKDKEFTLAELAVVVLIIGILAGIAIPAYQGYIAKGDTNALSGVDEYLNSLPSANIAFNTPRSMDLNSTYTVELLLSVVKAIEELKTEIKEKGELGGDNIKVSSNMEARLTGQGFEILVITPEKQSISGSNNTQWKWDISPKQEGIQKLHLTLTAFIDIDGKQSSRAIRTFDRDILVYVSLGKRGSDFFVSNWQWVLSTILIPIVVYLWTNKRRKNKDNV